MNNYPDITNYREVIEKEGFLVLLPVGVSMLPMLRQNKDTVVIKKLSERPCENDVVLFSRSNGRYVLHRVIKVKENGYVIRGDNCLRNEYTVKDENILGILEGFYKNEKYIDCKTNKRYLFYVKFWRAIYYPRTLYMLARIALSKIYHSIILR